MKVAKIIDRYTVAIATYDTTVKPGAILGIAEDDIIDPENGENLGGHTKLRVKVTEVHERYCIAETYRLTAERQKVTINIGDTARVLIAHAPPIHRSWINFTTGLRGLDWKRLTK